ncbi:30S ribosomal protein S7 [Patescibacteria group bacterium]|jgi:small subunit ribosomal protein S7|nr:30S ribosomal protein S7 [Patescibacteria group bacterium]
MRGKVKKNLANLKPDPIYGSLVVSKFIRYVMDSGKKSIAEKIVYSAIKIASEKLKTKKPDNLLEETLEKAAPIVEVRSRRVGGANYQVPVEVKEPRKTAIAMRWLLESARAVKGKPIAQRLADEIVNINQGTGATLKKREDIHRMAEANRAFAHFARY